MCSLRITFRKKLQIEDPVNHSYDEYSAHGSGKFLYEPVAVCLFFFSFVVALLIGSHSLCSIDDCLIFRMHNDLFLVYKQFCKCSHWLGTFDKVYPYKRL